MGKKFAITDRLQGIQMFKRIQFSRFFEQTFGHHNVNAAVDAIVQNRARQVNRFKNRFKIAHNFCG